MLVFFETLGEPSEPCDVGQLVDLIKSRTIEELKAEANLRDVNSILDEADLIYRYSWASVQSHLHRKEPPKGLHPSIVYERHYALNWLIRYGDANWDNVSTDT